MDVADNRGVVNNNSFGMTPSEKDSGAKSHATGAEGEVTSRGIVRSTKDERDTGGQTATEELKDKYPNQYFCIEDVILEGGSSRSGVGVSEDLDLDRGEYRTGAGVSDEAKRVIGSLRRNAGAWVELGASEYILDTVKNGYKIPFYETPEPAKFRNNKSALNEREFVNKAISDLIEIGGAIEVKVPPTVVNPLTVASKNSKKRLVLDLRYVNAHVWKEHGKFEDFKIFRSYIEKGDYMFSFDLKSGYHHIDIFEEHWEYLGFSWVGEDGVRRFYVFVVLPFGLCTAGYIFTKVCRVLVKFWRKQGIRIVLYIDDGIGASDSLMGCTRSSRVVRVTLARAGFVANSEKSLWEPAQILEWLGLEINTQEFKIKVRVKRVEKLLGSITKLKSAGRVTARQLSSIAGQIISTDLVLGPVTGLFTREMYAFIKGSPAWDRKAGIPEAVADEFEFWSNNIAELNERYLHEASAPISAKVNSDASSVAAGAVLISEGERLEAHKNFSATESNKSSTWRELETVRFAMEAFKEKLSGRVVCWETDNQGVVSICKKGSPKAELQNMARQIYFACRKEGIALDVYWVPREENVVADELSKHTDYDDWTTSDEFFQELNADWGPYTIDRFASSKNNKIRRYNSRFWNPGCEAVDALTQDWSGENNWLVPPVFLISRVIRHARDCKARGSLIVPLWESAPFWPLLRNGADTYREFVQGAKVYYDTGRILKLGDYRKSLLGSDRFTAPIMAIHFQF